VRNHPGIRVTGTEPSADCRLVKRFKSVDLVRGVRVLRVCSGRKNASVAFKILQRSRSHSNPDVDANWRRPFSGMRSRQELEWGTLKAASGKSTTRTSPFARATSPRKQKIKECSSRNLRIVLRFVLQTEPHGLRTSRNETDNQVILKGLAEREGFEPSVQVLARTTV
jgi:hypothetical protein